MNYSNIKKYDKSSMHSIYDRWPEIAQESFQSCDDGIDFGKIDHVIFAGMGGSGAIGDIFSSILSKTNVHVCVVKGYHLPNTVDSSTLVVTTSISGNTVETLSVLKAAKDLDCKTIAFSSGGMMEKFCRKNKVEHRSIPKLHSPRASFTRYLYSELGYLGDVIPIKKSDITDSITQMKKLCSTISSQNLTDTNQSLALARWITGIPIIYYPWGLQAVAIRFKSSLQENAKVHAMAEDVLEASHNGIVSWEKPSGVKPILIEGQDDYFKTKERWNIMKEYFDKHKIDYREIQSVKGNILSKLIGLIYMLDYSSIYLAIINKTDPSPTTSIDFVKERI
ncbi:MAG TPA: SIS domain-containing protein [Candidatus Nitrosotalea sp.]|nr:SIS domain-containing protein [Candidatus Nitrosotalea sp.]